MRATASTKRAIDRVLKGETPYAAAKAEGITTATIYNALKRLKLSEGVDLAPTPSSSKEKPTVANFTVKPDDLDLIDKAANILKTSRSDFMRQAVIDRAIGIIRMDEHGE